MRRLEQSRTGDGRELPPRVRAEIRRELQRLELVLQMIKAIEKGRNAIASGKAASSHPYANKIQTVGHEHIIVAATATIGVFGIRLRQLIGYDRLRSQPA